MCIPTRTHATHALQTERQTVDGNNSERVSDGEAIKRSKELVESSPEARRIGNESSVDYMGSFSASTPSIQPDKDRHEANIPETPKDDTHDFPTPRRTLQRTPASPTFTTLLSSTSISDARREYRPSSSDVSPYIGSSVERINQAYATPPSSPPVALQKLLPCRPAPEMEHGVASYQLREAPCYLTIRESDSNTENEDSMFSYELDPVWALWSPESDRTNQREDSPSPDADSESEPMNFDHISVLMRRLDLCQDRMDDVIEDYDSHMYGKCTSRYEVAQAFDARNTSVADANSDGDFSSSGETPLVNIANEITGNDDALEERKEYGVGASCKSVQYGVTTYGTKKEEFTDSMDGDELAELGLTGALCTMFTVIWMAGGSE
ncbi:hypothetical protein BDW02DRAFT_603329 [Decorospora gaudefroyi]|uniref:Uncharacterized protein n=1 Tax=Decorospora gaudefroyi TaxID=184978 RepID=A0A6A5JVV4_9PLEO|nr:hypothetical protein BDW02DRAFT_603329 [Decorospora gaudefroyi]